MTDEKQLAGLKRLMEPFAPDQISYLPKPTKAQTDAVRRDFKNGIRCKICGGWHHKDVKHFDYVGHAALTARLLEVDPMWVWEPLSTTDQGLPLLDKDGLLWINLTVCGVTRLGVGDAQEFGTNKKSPGDAMKERIGDALRNAAMRFGAALDLWHKGDDLFPDDAPKPETLTEEQFRQVKERAEQANVAGDAICSALSISALHEIPADKFVSVMKKLDATIAANQEQSPFEEKPND